MRSLHQKLIIWGANALMNFISKACPSPLAQLSVHNFLQMELQSLQKLLDEEI